ncbi:hypothetical protein ACIQTZ_16250 [Paenarthrobacter sp. NPDC090520]|uniref:hypothetical protein n=1 Tax=Paenarthrobacter sp. NPDC090520 TaxID=3364382 RepID=UPI0037FFBBC8
MNASEPVVARSSELMAERIPAATIIQKAMLTIWGTVLGPGCWLGQLVSWPYCGTAWP